MRLPMEKTARYVRERHTLHSIAYKNTNPARVYSIAGRETGWFPHAIFMKYGEGKAKNTPRPASGCSWNVGEWEIVSRTVLPIWSRERSGQYGSHYPKTWRYVLIANRAHLIVARATINGAIILWQEGHLRLRATLGTDYCMHLARSTLTIARTSSGVAAICTTGWAASRLILQTFLLVELLFSGSEYEIISALTAL